MPHRYKPLRFSQAGLRGLKVSATLALNERVREMWDTGQDVYQLGFGESRFPVHPKIAEALQKNAQRRSYLPALGIPELREAIADFYQRKFKMYLTPGQVVIGPGSKSLIYALLLALGEEVILPRPSWVSYAPQAHLLAKPVTWVPTMREHNFSIDVAILDQKIEESQQGWGNPEVLVLNTPNNPTGTMMQPQKIQELANYARDQELTIISDEIYALTAHGSTPHLSLGQCYPEGSIVCGGLSKHLSLGGWRFGVAILPPGRPGDALCRAVQTVASSIWSSVNAPVQYAALVAYSDDPDIDEYVQVCTQMHGIRTRYLYDTFVELRIPCAEPMGGFYVFPSFKKWQKVLATRGVYTDEDLAVYLLEQYGLATLPGAAFNTRPEDLYLRLSSSYIDAGTDQKAEALLAAFRKDPDPERFIAQYHPRMQEVANRLANFVNDLKED